MNYQWHQGSLRNGPIFQLVEPHRCTDALRHLVQSKVPALFLVAQVYRSVG